MKMMLIPEAVEALGHKLTESQLRHGITTGRYRGAKIGGRVVIDLESVPEAPDGKGLVTVAQLLERTGLSHRQFRNGVREGWIKPVKRGGRNYYDDDAVMAAINRKMRGGRRG